MKPDPTDRQLTLPFNQTGDALGRHLAERLRRPVTLVLTHNSTTMLSARVREGVLRVRLHRMFLSADGPVIEEIVSYLKYRRGRMPHFRGFVRANRNMLLQKTPNKVPLRAVGRYHDLSELYDEINRDYFGGKVTAAITWGTRSPRLAVRKRTVGSYSDRSNTIRINPVLDKKTVPRFYVAFIVYHEMLHAATGTPTREKRRTVHSPEFRRREMLFAEYEKVIAWEGGKCPD